MRINAAKLQAKVGVTIKLSEVVKCTAVVRPYGTRESCIDYILSDIPQVITPQKQLVIAIVLAVSNCKVVNQPIFFDFLDILHVFYQLFECGKQLHVVSGYGVLTVGVLGEDLSGYFDSLALKVADEGLN